MFRSQWCMCPMPFDNIIFWLTCPCVIDPSYPEMDNTNLTCAMWVFPKWLTLKINALPLGTFGVGKFGLTYKCFLLHCSQDEYKICYFLFSANLFPSMKFIGWWLFQLDSDRKQGLLLPICNFTLYVKNNQGIGSQKSLRSGTLSRWLWIDKTAHRCLLGIIEAIFQV